MLAQPEEPLEFDLDFDAQLSAEPEHYRQSHSLAFKTGGMADEIVVIQATASGEVTYPHYKPQTWDSLPKGTGRLVELGAVRCLYRVDTVVQNEVLEIYRIDVDAVAEEPSVTIQSQQAITQDFIDKRFVIRRDGNDTLSYSDLSEVWVTSVPGGVRLGLAPAGKLDEAVYFWNGVDQISNVDFSAVLQQMLNRQLSEVAELGLPRPEQLDLLLLVESFVPCKVQLSSLQISHRIVSNSWLDVLPERDNTKRVLRFAGECLDCRTESISLPSTATVFAAELRTIESWGNSGGAVPVGNGGVGASPQAPQASPTQKNGIRVGVDGWVAQTFQPDKATSMAALALGLLPLSKDSELCVQVREVVEGRPTGSHLLETVVELGAAGRPAWVMVHLPKPVVLNQQPYWLLLKAAEGQLVWLVEEGDASQSIWQQPGSEGTWVLLSDLDGKTALYQLFAVQSGTPGVIGTPIGNNIGGSKLWIGDQSLPGLSQGVDGVVSYELTPTLNAYLANQSGGMMMLEGEGGPSSPTEASIEDQVLIDETILYSIPLIFDGVGLKQITLFPPRIEFTY